MRDTPAVAELDPRLKPYVERALSALPAAEVPLAALRAGMLAELPEIWGVPEEVDEVVDILIPGPGGDLPVRVYRPRSTGLLPGLVWFHGGGWVVGDLDTHDPVCRAIANRGPCVVVAVDYRLAPEHPFPAALEDAWVATEWVAEEALSLGIDATRIAVGGDSAGGNLAAVVAQMAQDSQDFAVALQVLIYPMTDQSRDYPSYERNASGYMLTTAALRWFMDNYIPDSEDRKETMASPMLRPSLEGLPPALVISAEFDPLVDENEAYAKRLTEAGVRCDYVCFAGMIHPFFTLGGVVEDAGKAEDLIAAEMRQLKNPGRTS
jgi:acetyl esterase